MSKEDRDSEENNGRDKNFYRHTRLDVLRRHRRRDGSGYATKKRHLLCIQVCNCQRIDWEKIQDLNLLSDSNGKIVSSEVRV